MNIIKKLIDNNNVKIEINNYRIKIFVNDKLIYDGLLTSNLLNAKKVIDLNNNNQIINLHSGNTITNITFCKNNNNYKLQHMYCDCHKNNTSNINYKINNIEHKFVKNNNGKNELILQETNKIMDDIQKYINIIFSIKS